MRFLFAAMVVASSLIWCFCVSASEIDDEARVVFDTGTKLFHEGKYSEAAEAFRKANELKPNWKLLYNIGQSEAAAKRYGLALETFERYLAEGGDEIDGMRHDEVLAEIDNLRKKVGSLDVRAPDSSVVEVDGIVRGSTPLPGLILVAAGSEHHVSVRHGENVIVDRVVRLTGGQAMVLDVDKKTTEEEIAPTTQVAEETAVKDPVESEKAPTDESRGLHTVGWIAVGVGAAVLVGGAVTGGIALSKDRELKDNCDDGVCPASYNLQVEQQRDRLALTTDILIPTGGVIAAAGIVMLIVDAGDDEGDTGESTAAVVPRILPGGVGLTLEGRF